jgi:hypothetical protein
MAVGSKLRWKVFSRDNYTCQYCGRRPPDAVLEVEHVVPVSKGGKDEETNLTTACEECNRGKSDQEVWQHGSELHSDIEYLVEAYGLTRLQAYLEAIATRACIIDDITLSCIMDWPSYYTREDNWPYIYELLHLVEVYRVREVEDAFRALNKHLSGLAGDAAVGSEELEAVRPTLPTVDEAMEWLRQHLSNGPLGSLREEMTLNRQRRV